MVRSDPRIYQVGILSVLLIYGLAFLDFGLDGYSIAVMLGTALMIQYLFTIGLKLPNYDPRSPLISALSLCLLLRTDSLPLAGAAATAIASKFLIRWRAKHLFNPTNLALVALLLASDEVWVSPGQWGHIAFFAFLTVCLGMLVVYRVRRSDITLAFLACYTTLVLGRALWLGDPWPIPLHQLQSGALLIFAFFMISDPKTTPDSRWGRIIFAALVAVGAFYMQYGLYRPNGLHFALAACVPFVPLLDRLFPDTRYRWQYTAAKVSKQSFSV